MPKMVDRPQTGTDKTGNMKAYTLRVCLTAQDTEADPKFSWVRASKK